MLLTGFSVAARQPWMMTVSSVTKATSRKSYQANCSDRYFYLNNY